MVQDLEKDKCFIEFNLINYQHNIGEMYMLKIPMEPKYQLLIKKHEQIGLENFEDSKLSLNFRSVSKMFMKIMMCTIQEKFN